MQTEGLPSGAYRTPPWVWGSLNRFCSPRAAPARDFRGESGGSCGVLQGGRAGSSAWDSRPLGKLQARGRIPRAPTWVFTEAWQGGGPRWPVRTGVRVVAPRVRGRAGARGGSRQCAGAGGPRGRFPRGGARLLLAAQVSSPPAPRPPPAGCSLRRRLPPSSPAGGWAHPAASARLAPPGPPPAFPLLFPSSLPRSP